MERETHVSQKFLAGSELSAIRELSISSLVVNLNISKYQYLFFLFLFKIMVSYFFLFVLKNHLLLCVMTDVFICA